MEKSKTCEEQLKNSLEEISKLCTSLVENVIISNASLPDEVVVGLGENGNGDFLGGDFLEEDDDDSCCDDDDDYNEMSGDMREFSLHDVEWKQQASSVTKQYHQITGKISSGTNPQNSTKEKNQSIIKQYENLFYFGPYIPEAGKSFRKTEDYSKKSRDKSDQATHEKALDVQTKTILYKMFQKVFTKFDGCVSTGKEANVYHATSAKREGGSLAVKVFKTVASEFRNRTQYMAGEFRFQYNTCTSNIRKLVPKWTEKEFRNLQRIYKAGIKCPEPILYHGNVLVMEFLGEDGRPANRLKDEVLTQDEYERIYRECVLIMRKMFQVCKLVHADLSEFNLLVFQKNLYVIDVSQSVEMDNESALKFLNMDVQNITNYFRKQSIVTMSCKKLRNFIVDAEITNEERYMDEAIEKACDRPDEDDDDLMVDQTEIPNHDADMCVKDLRRHAGQAIIELKAECRARSSDSDERASDDSNDDDDSGDSDEDGAEENEKNDKSKLNKKNATDQKVFLRPKNESPESKKERKKVIKEMQKTKRTTKLPKSEKKRRIKMSKNKKS